jgi:molybdopterin synthase catalytic subunit
VLSGPLSAPADGDDWVALTAASLTVDLAQQWAAIPAAGAVVAFLGVVRDHAEGRTGVEAMTYEAYEQPAVRAMHEIAALVRRRWPAVARIALLHRIGELGLGEVSVAVVVSSAHRDVAFEAARFAIDTLKESVPIWKQEHWSGRSDWAVEQHAIRPVGSKSGS